MLPIDAQKHPGRKAASAARALSALLFIFFAIISTLSVIWNRMPPPLMFMVFGTFYIVPAVTVLALSGKVGRAQRGPTIAVLIIASLLAVFLSFGVILNVIMLMRLPMAFTPVDLVRFILGPVLSAVMNLVAITLAVYCVKSLRFPDAAQRGFAPLMPEESVPVATAAGSTGDRATLPDAAVNDR